MSWATDTMAVTVLGQALDWDDLTGDALGAEKGMKARRMEIEYFKQLQVKLQVKTSEAEDSEFWAPNGWMSRRHPARTVRA